MLVAVRFLALGLPGLPLDRGARICPRCTLCSRVSELPRCRWEPVLWAGRGLSFGAPEGCGLAWRHWHEGAAWRCGRPPSGRGPASRSLPRHAPVSESQPRWWRGAALLLGELGLSSRGGSEAAIPACLHLPAELLWRCFGVGGQRAAGMALGERWQWLGLGAGDGFQPAGDRHFCLCH